MPTALATDISRALLIDGYMKEPELTWLAEQAQQYNSIVELGCFLGRSTRALGDNTAGKVIALDDWQGPREVFIRQERRIGLYREFQDNLEDLIIAGKVLPLHCDHAKPPNLDGFNPDMVFIDGDHSLEGAKRDINYWLPRIAPGGLICGDDVHDVFVRQAVLECFENPGVVPNTNIWAVYV